jgi:hypothetical protein
VEIEKTLYCGWNIIELSIAFLMFLVWGRVWGRDLSVPQWKAFTFLIAGVILSCAFLMFTYGYHYKSIEQYDDWYEGKYVQDFEPTRAERYEYGLKVFLFFFASSLIGYYSGRQKAREYEESFEKLLEEMRKKGLISVEGKDGNTLTSENKIEPFQPRPTG